MPSRLAEISWLQNRLDDGADPALAAHAVEAATAKAMTHAKRDLTRSERIVEYPDGGYKRSIYLGRRPVEAIHSVKQRALPSSEAAFEETDPLDEFEDYTSQNSIGRLDRMYRRWHAGENRLQVIYTAGYLDPAGLPAAVVGAAVAGETSVVVDQPVGEGDTLVFDADGDDEQIVKASAVVGVGPYTVTLDAALAADVADEATLDYFPASAILPPESLQHAIIEQAVWIYNTAGTGGIRQIDTGEGGSSVTFGETKLHPSLRDAVIALPSQTKVGFL